MGVSDSLSVSRFESQRWASHAFPERRPLPARVSGGEMFVEESLHCDFIFKKTDLLSMDNVLLSHYPLFSGYHLGMIPGRENPLEKGMAIHSSILNWRIPWIEEACRLQFRASQRVGHD